MLSLRVAQISLGLGALAGGTGALRGCGDDAPSTAPATDAGAAVNDENPGQCPDVAPAPGATCHTPEGTTCDFGTCGARIAVCSGGFWRFSATPNDQPACPAIAPDLQSTCPSCWPTDRTCTYGSSDCTAADASANTVLAACRDGGWTLTVRACRPPPDAGADVQGDAAPDGD